MYDPPSHGPALIASAGIACFLTAASFIALMWTPNPLAMLIVGLLAIPFGLAGAIATLAPLLFATEKILGRDALLPAGAMAGLAHTCLGALLVQRFGDFPDFGLEVLTGTLLVQGAAAEPLGLPVLAACAGIAGGMAGLYYEKRIAREFR